MKNISKFKQCLVLVLFISTFSAKTDDDTGSEEMQQNKIILDSPPDDAQRAPDSGTNDPFIEENAIEISDFGIQKANGVKDKPASNSFDPIETLMVNDNDSSEGESSDLKSNNNNDDENQPDGGYQDKKSRNNNDSITLEGASNNSQSAPLVLSTLYSEDSDEIITEPFYSFEEIHVRYVLAAIAHLMLVMNGVFLLFKSLKNFMMSLAILSFDLAYYLILMLVAHSPYLKPNNLTHEIGLLVISLSFGFLFLLLTFIFEGVEYLIAGSAIGMVVSIYYAQFFLDLSNEDDKFNILGVYLFVSGLVIVAGKIYTRHAFVITCTIIGSLTVTMNLGILRGDLISFEDRDKMPLNSFFYFVVYTIIAIVLFVSGIYVQLSLWKKELRNISETSPEQPSSESFEN